MANTHNSRWINLYSTKAYVFHLNPDTMNSWVQKVKKAVNISFLANSGNDNSPNAQTRQELKIVATEDNGDIILEDPITAEFNFTVLSKRFCQWVDNSGTICGLGFQQDEQLTEIIETFKRLKSEITQPSQPIQRKKNPTATQVLPHQQHDRPIDQPNDPRHQVLAGGDEFEGRLPQRGSVSSSNMQPSFSNTLAHPGHKQQATKRQQAQHTVNNGDAIVTGAHSNVNGDNTFANNPQSYPRSHSTLGFHNSTLGLQSKPLHNGTPPKSRPAPEDSDNLSDCQSKEQLRYENERLRQALEESSSNAGIWQSELMTLRTNNVKLTQALQESKANVEEWQRELSSLRDENEKLKMRVAALEAGNVDHDKLQKHKKDIFEMQKESLIQYLNQLSFEYPSSSS